LREPRSEGMNTPSRARVPEGRGPVAAAAREGYAVGREGERGGTPPMARQASRDRARIRVAELDQAVGAGAGERLSAGCEGDREHLHRMIRHGPDGHPGRGIPDTDDALAIGTSAATGDAPAVGREGYRHDLIGRIAQPAE